MQRLNIFEHKRGQGENKGIGKISWKEKKEGMKKTPNSLTEPSHPTSVTIGTNSRSRKEVSLLVEFLQNSEPGTIARGQRTADGNFLQRRTRSRRCVEVHGDISFNPALGGSAWWHFIGTGWKCFVTFQQLPSAADKICGNTWWHCPAGR